MTGSTVKAGLGFVCPKCGSDKTHVCDSRGNKDSSHRHRRRFCEVCDHRFSTVEITRAEYEALIGNTGLRELRMELVALIDRRIVRIVPRPGETPQAVEA